MNNLEKRSIDVDMQIRSSEDGKKIVEGYAARFNEETTIGGRFAERIAPGAFKGTNMSQTVALFNHDYNQPLARMGQGLELEVDEKGLKYRFELGDQSYAKDLAINIRDGIVSTSSFGFTIEDDSWEKRDDGLNLRTINSVNVLYDVSPTTQGAYDTTEVGLRSMEDALAVEEELIALGQERIAQQEMEEVVVEEVEDSVESRSPGVDSDYDGVKDEDEDEEGKMQEEDEEEEEEKMQEEDEKEEDERNKENPEPEARNTNISNKNNMEEKNSAPAIIQGMGDTVGKVQERYSFGKALKEAANGNLSGLEAEMSQEARNEYKGAQVNISKGFCVPSMMLRATDDTIGVGATSDGNLHKFGGTIGTVDQGLIAAFRPNDIATQMGARNINGVSGNVVFQVQNAEVDASKPAEGVAGTLDNPDFTAVTMAPTRYAAYTAVSEQLMAQSAGDMGAFIAADIRKAIDEKFNADVLAAIDTAADGSGTITADASATNAAALLALYGLEADLMGEDVPLENIRVLAGATAFRSARTISMDAGSGMLVAPSPLERLQVLGYPAVVNSSITPANIYLADASNCATATWGGLNIMIDPYTFAEKGVIRIITNVYKDFKVLNAKGFAGLSSFDLSGS